MQKFTPVDTFTSIGSNVTIGSQIIFDCFISNYPHGCHMFLDKNTNVFHFILFHPIFEHNYFQMSLDAFKTHCDFFINELKNEPSSEERINRFDVMKNLVILQDGTILSKINTNFHLESFKGKIKALESLIK